MQAETWDVECKADHSPLTRADREANNIICEGLTRIGEQQRWTHVRLAAACGTNYLLSATTFYALQLPTSPLCLRKTDRWHLKRARCGRP
jgi:hypothetical protein